MRLRGCVWKRVGTRCREKPRIKCADCPNRRFLPLTDDVIRWHLSGCDPDGQPFVVGMYPLLQDETCFFLAVDLTRRAGPKTLRPFAKRVGASTSQPPLNGHAPGTGAHMWFFFDQAVPAALARRLGSHLLTETMEGRPDIGRALAVNFQGELRPEQKSAADAMLAHETGVLAATTASGKPVIAAWLIAQRRINTIVLVHRRQLLDQWIERLSTFLGVSAKSIGRIGSGRSRPTGMIDVAVIQSLVRRGVVDDCIAEYGHLIVDECHHISAHSFEQVARQAKARFVLGLSATVARKDGHHPIIFMQCGPIRHRVDARAQAAARPFEHFVLVQPTAFQSGRTPDPDKRVEFQALYQELIDDELRTRRICDDVVDSVRAGRSPLVLTERNDRLDRLEQGLVAKVSHVVALRAGMGKKQRQAISDRLAGDCSR